MALKVSILTLFPELFTQYLNTSILKKAKELNLFFPEVLNIRDFSRAKNKQVDDYPYGGGRGMVLKCEPIFSAINFLKEKAESSFLTILMSPEGELFNSDLAEELSKREYIIMISAHYEGVDERIKTIIDREVSVGDYILTGGELPALVLVDAVVRLIPGVLPEESIKEESFTGGLLDYPKYTRPEICLDLKVPDILLSGDHKKIKEWRRKEAIKRTFFKRPDLLQKARLLDSELKFIESLKGEKIWTQ